MRKGVIRKVAVLGSGVMGSRIALHLAGAGIPVLLLDILPRDISETASIKERNKTADTSLQTALRSSPSPLFHKDALQLISTGNFTDHIKDIQDADWIIEVVTENIEIKRKLFDEVEKHRRAGSIISSNTSGIPIIQLTEGRSEDFKQHFCGTHFFNPPRYLPLLEIIPGPDTSKDVINFMMPFGDRILGKNVVLCKDTPAFIANRIGVFAIMTLFRLSRELSLSIEEVDVLTGPLSGRPKSATFRTSDVVGIDTLVKVAKGIYNECPEDEARTSFAIPDWLQQMTDKNMLGDKSGGGFYKKIKKGAESSLQTLDLDTLTYREHIKAKISGLDTIKNLPDLGERLRALMKLNNQAGELFRKFHFALFSYVSHRIPEISDHIYQIDEAVKAGFGWELGPFETWDALDPTFVLSEMHKNGFTAAAWVEEILSSDRKYFYGTASGKRACYDTINKNHQPIPGSEDFIILKQFTDKTVWTNGICRVYDIGDEVLALEWKTKMNSIGGEVLEGINKAIDLAEKQYNGLVIANSGPEFSAGANVGLIFMLAAEQDFDELDMAVRLFQNTMMRVRYSGIPVVVAPHGLTLGGGCELCLHADKIIASAECYMGLVEAGIGVIPGGGGTKEFILRASDERHEGEPEHLTLQHRFLTIAKAQVSTSAHEAFDLGILKKGRDEICMNAGRRIARAKSAILMMQEAGYVQPVMRKDIKVVGQSALGAFYAGINGMWRAHYATDHDVKVARKLAFVMCGGDLSDTTLVSEKYLLDLEREAFLSLAGERKSLERMQSILKTGKPLRN